jgi:dipeptidyl aminopeptidase/acylaminoacyl peptidase
MDITPDPFAAVTNTTWNASGYVTTAATTRIRNVRVGKTDTNYAYYGDAGVNANPNFYAIDLATGASTLLGNAGTLTGGGSYGLWTVSEADGYLYVQTTDNGVQVYSMTNATTLGSLYTSYSKSEIDGLFASPSAQYWGFDVSPNGQRMVLSGASGVTYEIIPEPASGVLAIAALVAFLLFRWRKSRIA